MARIGSTTFPLQAGTVERDVPGGARLIAVRLDGAQGRAFAILPDPPAPLETRKIHVVQAGVDMPVADPAAFRFIGLITTGAGVDWFVFEREIG